MLVTILFGHYVSSMMKFMAREPVDRKPPLPLSAENTGSEKHFVNHNDSEMLMQIGNAIGGISAPKIYYQTPTERMSQFVNRGDLFFDGSLQSDTHEVLAMPV